MIPNLSARCCMKNQSLQIDVQSKWLLYARDATVGFLTTNSELRWVTRYGKDLR